MYKYVDNRSQGQRLYRKTIINKILGSPYTISVVPVFFFLSASDRHNEAKYVNNTH